MYSNMVLLTIFTTSNPHTLYFDHPIEKPNYIRLLSMSLYNSWYNLKGNTALTFRSLTAGKIIKNINQGHYTLEQLSKEITGSFATQKVDLKTELNTPVSLMTIYNNEPPQGTDIEMSTNLTQLFGLNEATLRSVVNVKRLYPSTYFVHCDLLDKRQNLLNGKPSTVLARFDICGQPFEKVQYQTPQPHVLRDTESSDYDVNSITLSVKDEKGHLFDFNGMPLEFEVEIN